MSTHPLLADLNERQQQAVSATDGHMLVLAGAGSGKTRVLVHRIAWLIQERQYSPFSVLAVTFTNKAAAEMRGRVEQLVGSSVRGMWIGTFHGLAHRLLRAHYMDVGLPQNFQILDSDDQQRLIKRLIKSLNLDDKRWPAKQAQWYINGKKDEGLRPQHIETYDPTEQTLKEIYTLYQESCDRAGLVDFAELLLRAHELLRNNRIVREHYQNRFRHILVDEFQDTNSIQYAWVRLLAGEQNSVTIVGDDDQSIYGWRGAKVENIHQFLSDFEGAETIRLEQNYRSTSTILRAANSVISNNSGRLGKDLWTDGNDGEPISLYAGFNEMDEARYIVARIEEWRDQGGSLQDAALLYRSNAQSRILEEALLHARIPYRIYGGLRFFDRQEIKDALAYLRILGNRDDDAAIERVINTPTRGIGNRTLEMIRQAARERGESLWQASKYMVNEKQLAGRARNAVGSFLDFMEALDDETEEFSLGRLSDEVIKKSGLMAMYEAEKGEKAETRVENLKELVTACENFTLDDAEEDMTPLNAFLAHAALEAGEEQADEYQDAVQLMTLHSAKGLEFPLVFMTGVEEGLFPSQQSMDEPGRLEEERRLCYVGMTRAMQKLVLTYAEQRRIYGQELFHKVSRFISEIPPDTLHEVRIQTKVEKPSSYSRFNNAASHEAFEQTGYSLGQRVRHPKFGEGTVLNYEGTGPQSRVQINFDNVGSKWLVVSYARLDPVF
ncbi:MULTISPECIES: DNA helicase II [Idiomarina]|jgi:DNA helicase-2/ATP-dependent DNA helicase PcrA|uniref:DNA 3'-5' helicase n=12 Tax=Idiomarina TaxID=135575 RepID=A0A8I1KD70_9GAMM|nr:MULTISPECIES: DNA helicase II [Idiomarina]KPD21030.1 DNA-dependent helicase II [Idiomarina abyssalis]MBH93437.1 DNA helicase II [Idiomarina sp.]MBJ7267537.1 DNA helicase II [Idiomarina abyssalis]MBJ7273918.1 DNA helicase II [Idiomarina abyssalis]MBJ7314686.1 DNA helicase II [Idiomarina abyssalis]|tara:strand:- start:21534 stop:23705 length:2172 start_codon:yes stop_codon:yes gene_type:complete